MEPEDKLRHILRYGKASTRVELLGRIEVAFLECATPHKIRRLTALDGGAVGPECTPRPALEGPLTDDERLQLKIDEQWFDDQIAEVRSELGRRANRVEEPAETYRPLKRAVIAASIATALVFGLPGEADSPRTLISELQEIERQASAADTGFIIDVSEEPEPNPGPRSALPPVSFGT